MFIVPLIDATQIHCDTAFLNLPMGSQLERTIILVFRVHADSVLNILSDHTMRQDASVFLSSAHVWSEAIHFKQ